MRLIYNQFQLTLDELYSNMVSGVFIQRLNKSQLEFNKRFLDQFDRFFVFLGSTQLWWHAINFIRADWTVLDVFGNPTLSRWTYVGVLIPRINSKTFVHQDGGPKVELFRRLVITCGHLHLIIQDTSDSMRFCPHESIHQIRLIQK